MNTSYAQIKQQLLDAALAHVVFDGWSNATFQAAVQSCVISPDMAAAVCPRGAVDLAIAYHQRADQTMRDALETADLSHMRFRDRIAHAIRLRLEAISDKDAVRRGAALFALPLYAGDGAKLVWGTADAIWDALGDSSDDVNWYSKRATLCAVYSATVLFWLGDQSEVHADTWAFLERRIDNVMQFERLKSKVKDTPLLNRAFAGPQWMLKQIKAPAKEAQFPGKWSRS